MSELRVPQEWAEEVLGTQPAVRAEEAQTALPQPGRLVRVLGFVGFMLKHPFAIAPTEFPAPGMSEHFDLAQKRNDPRPPIDPSRVR